MLLSFSWDLRKVSYSNSGKRNKKSQAQLSWKKIQFSKCALKQLLKKLRAVLQTAITFLFTVLTNYYRFRKEYLVSLIPYFERSIESFFSMRMCALCELLISLISFFNSIIFRALVMSFIHHYKINLLTFLLYARGLLL